MSKKIMLTASIDEERDPDLLKITVTNCDWIFSKKYNEFFSDQPDDFERVDALGNSLIWTLCQDVLSLTGTINHSSVLDYEFNDKNNSKELVSLFFKNIDSNSMIHIQIEDYYQCYSLVDERITSTAFVSKNPIGQQVIALKTLLFEPYYSSTEYKLPSIIEVPILTASQEDDILFETKTESESKITDPLVKNMEMRHLRSSDQSTVTQFYIDWVETGTDSIIACPLFDSFSEGEYNNLIGLFIDNVLVSIAIIDPPGVGEFAVDYNEYITLCFLGTHFKERSKGYATQLLGYVLETLSQEQIGKGLIFEIIDEDLIDFYEVFDALVVENKNDNIVMKIDF